jgi:DNA-binding PadR family transcriptional regulator
MPRRPDTSPQTLLVLDALLDQAATWRYGYDLSKETGLKSGTLYPILMRLADRGMLETRWEPADPPGRPPRRLCRLTADGVRAANGLVAEARAPRQWATPSRPAEGVG